MPSGHNKLLPLLPPPGGKIPFVFEKMVTKVVCHIEGDEDMRASSQCVEAEVPNNAVHATSIGTQLGNTVFANPIGREHENTLPTTAIGRESKSIVLATPIGKEYKNIVPANPIGIKPESTVHATPIGLDQT